MTEAERLAERLETEATAWERHGNQSEWRETLRSAAALIRSQAEELERLRGALGNIRALAQKRLDEGGHNGNLSDVLGFARAALGER